MADTLHVSLREEIGTRAVRRLRKAGKTPAVLYGHGQPCVHLSIPAPEVRAAIRHGSQLVNLTGDVSEKALIRDVQWDTFSLHVLHIDLTRVSEQERVTVFVPLELRGEAPGAKQGGVVEHLLHELEIECPAGEIPEKLVASVKTLELAGTVTAGQVDLPEHTTLVTPADTVVAHCLALGVAAGEEMEEETAPTGPSEPEVIGRKAEESEEGAE